MLKKISWIAALLAAFAMVFFGCIEPGVSDGSEPPVQLPDLKIEGEDIILKKMGSSAGQAMVTIDGAKVTFKGASVTSAGFYYEFPAAAAAYPQVVVYFKVLEIKTGRPGFLVKNYDMSNYAGIVNDQDPNYQMNDTKYHFAVGTEYDTGEKPTNAFKNGRIGFQHQAYDNGVVAESGSTTVNQNVEYTIEVTKIVFPGAGEVVDVTPPKFGGDATKVVYTKTTATPAVETVVDSDPLVTGAFGMDVSADGYFKFNKSGRIHYKFPASATGFTGDPKLEADWDFVKVEYLVKGVVTGKDAQGNEVATAIEAKTKIIQYESGDDTYTKVTGGEWQSLSKTGTDAAPSVLNLQTWGSGGTGGFSIRINDYDLVSGAGTSNSCADVFEVKIVKVTFTKGDRYKVSFYVDNNPPSVYEVLDVNNISDSNIPATVTAPKRVGWTFRGWFDDYSGTPNRVMLNTTISADTSLYAMFEPKVLDPIVVSAAAGKTLFAATDSYAGGTTPAAVYTYPATGATAAEYWIVSDSRSTGYDDWSVDAVAPFNDDGDPTATPPVPDGPGVAIREAIHALQDSYGSTAGYTRIGYTFPAGADQYDSVKITYDLVLIGGTTGVLVRNGPTGTSSEATVGGSGKNLDAGTGKTLTVSISDLNGGVSFVKDSTDGAFLLRITKIELLID